jgi:hypothetical protein
VGKNAGLGGLTDLVVGAVRYILMSASMYRDSTNGVATADLTCLSITVADCVSGANCLEFRLLWQVRWTYK